MRNGQKFEAALFDFDGVLAKTMEDHFLAWKKALMDFGADLVKEEYFPFEGMRLGELAKKYLQEKSIKNVRFDELVRRKENYYLRNFSFRLYPEVNEIVDILNERQVPLAIVTTGFASRIKKSVPRFFLKKFRAVITAEKVTRGKPYPEPYLLAASELGVVIAHCIAIENSPLGVESAKKAGAYCIAITSTVDASQLFGADEIIKDFGDLMHLESISRLSGVKK